MDTKYKITLYFIDFKKIGAIYLLNSRGLSYFWFYENDSLFDVDTRIKKIDEGIKSNKTYTFHAQKLDIAKHTKKKTFIIKKRGINYQ